MGPGGAGRKVVVENVVGPPLAGRAAGGGSATGLAVPDAGPGRTVVAVPAAALATGKATEVRLGL
jgi:hypothetical protein